MPQQSSEIVAVGTAAGTVNVSEIQSLINRAGELSRAADRWNSAMLWALVFAALAAVAVVLTTWMALRRAKQLAVVQDKIIELKDSQLLLDLKEKDARIAEAGDRASAAEAKAEGFRLDIAKANERAAALEVEALKLRKGLISQGPRANLIAGENRRQLVEALKAFATQKIDVRHSAGVIMVNSHIVQVTPIGDDSLGLANALMSVLREARWNLPPNALPTSSTRHGDGCSGSISQYQSSGDGSRCGSQRGAAHRQGATRNRQECGETRGRRRYSACLR